MTLTQDDEAFRRCRDCGPEPDAAPIDCFALDSRVIRLRRWRALGGGTAAYYEEYPVFYRVAERGRTVQLVSAHSNAKVRTPLMRVVRELARAPRWAPAPSNRVAGLHRRRSPALAALDARFVRTVVGGSPGCRGVPSCEGRRGV